MHFPRLWANTVLLADGTVLVVGGGTTSYYGGPIRTAEIYNPATRTWTEMAAQTAPRMYHSTALLLPDGRVLSAGQSSGKYENTGEIFSPPYLFKGARPRISKAPGTLSYGQAFTVTTPGSQHFLWRRPLLAVTTGNNWTSARGLHLYQQRRTLRALPTQRQSRPARLEVQLFLVTHREALGGELGPGELGCRGLGGLLACWPSTRRAGCCPGDGSP
jgi:hypothetical protein